jgi:hypothetical protein
MLQGMCMTDYDNHPVFIPSDATPPLSSGEISDLRLLLALDDERRTSNKRQPPVPDDVGTAETNVDLAERIFASRGHRAEIFGSNMFVDPAYDILLYMFIMAGRGQMSDVGGVCRASGAPDATALRYIKSLVEKGYINRAPHPYDKRISNLTITPMATNLMNEWLRRFAATLSE